MPNAFPSGLGVNMQSRNSSAMPSPFVDIPEGEEDGRPNGRMNGHVMKSKPRLPGRRHQVTDSQQVRDAEEFELEGLISDVDEDAEDVGPREEQRRKEQSNV